MVDRDKMKSLLGGSDELVDQCISIFKQETPSQLSNLLYAVQNTNWEQASIIAHTIKSQCKYLFLTNIAEDAFTIERDTEKGENLDKIESKVVELSHKIEAIIQSL